jgi:hypothetical protein
MVKAARVSVLILLLACSAQAGYIPNGTSEPTTPPPPPPATASAAEEESTQGASADDLGDALTEAALSLLNNVLILL